MRWDDVWFASGTVPAAARAALSPLGAVYCGAMAARNVCYDRGWLVRHAAGAPVISVGNLSVGGTGKTPVTAYLTGELIRLGAKPAVVLRGYGGDEADVHRVLNPRASVIVDVDRVRGARAAVAEGATVVLVDDGFQHRRLVRAEDLVLVDAERGRLTGCLPAGPLRESAVGLRRATLVIVTVKSASEASARRLIAEIASHTTADGAIVRLSPRGLHRVGADGDDDWERPLEDVAGKSALVVSAVANPAAFEAQVEQLGVQGFSMRYGDHHAFSPADVAHLAIAGTAMDLIVCTLKDAVKLKTLWPHNAPPLWYVSQRLEPVWGGEAIDRLLTRVLRATTFP